MKQVDGRFVYDMSAAVYDKTVGKTTVTVILCITFCILVAVSVTLCVVVKNRNRQETVCFKKEPAFRNGDIAVYFAVATLIVMLFVAFAVSPAEDRTIAFVKAVDMTDGKTIFSYDVSRNEWIVDEDNWIVDVEAKNQKIVVTLHRKGDEQHLNVFEINREGTLSVRMSDAVCGAHKDCVNNFGAIDGKGQSLVCSPNGLKIVSE